MKYFWWQLAGILFYVPWNILPIFYILWCHQRTYKQTLKHLEYLEQRKTRASQAIKEERVSTVDVIVMHDSAAPVFKLSG